MKISHQLFILILLFFVFGILPIGNAQDVNESNSLRMKLHNEKPDDAYVANPENNRLVSKAYQSKSIGVFTNQVNIDANGMNILNDAANEPSMSIDPNNTNNIVIGWRQFDNIVSNFRQAGYAYSSDGGQTWTFPGVINPGIFRSDPVLDADANGVMYYNSLTSNNGEYTCKVFKSLDGGATWDQGTEAKGGDKQWMVIDRSGGVGQGNIYSFWTTSWSMCYPGNFTRSVTAGNSYEDCIPVAGDPYWGTLAVGPDGVLYIVGSGWQGVVVAKSTNAQNPLTNTTWDFSTQVNLDGNLTYGSNVNPGGLLGQASIAVDHSEGVNNGNVYVLSSVQRFNGDPGDVMFAKSTNGGQIWSVPKRVNQDLSTSNTQWFGTMSVAPNGRIDAIWLDNREAPSNIPQLSALYYSYSIDQGENWSVNQRISEVFNSHLGWPNQEKMGDYFHLISDDNGTSLAWAGTFNGEQDVYFTRIDVDITSTNDLNNREMIMLTAYPNPSNGSTLVSYEINERTSVELSIFDLFGKQVQLIENGIKDAGAYSVQLSTNELSSGIYLCRLKSTTTTKSIRLLVE